jgi:hypothetical protein
MHYICRKVSILFVPALQTSFFVCYTDLFRSEGKQSLKIPKGQLESVYRRTQWPKEKVQKDKQRSTKHTYKTKDGVTRTPLKTGSELRCSGRVSSCCSTSDTCRGNLVMFIFLPTICACCVYTAMSNSTKQLRNCLKKSRNKRRLSLV